MNVYNVMLNSLGRRTQICVNAEWRHTMQYRFIYWGKNHTHPNLWWKNYGTSFLFAFIILSLVLRTNRIESLRLWNNGKNTTLSPKQCWWGDDWLKHYLVGPIWFMKPTKRGFPTEADSTTHPESNVGLTQKIIQSQNCSEKHTHERLALTYSTNCTRRQCGLALRAKRKR